MKITCHRVSVPTAFQWHIDRRSSMAPHHPWDFPRKEAIMAIHPWVPALCLACLVANGNGISSWAVNMASPRPGHRSRRLDRLALPNTALPPHDHACHWYRAMHIAIADPYGPHGEAPAIATSRWSRPTQVRRPAQPARNNSLLKCGYRYMLPHPSRKAHPACATSCRKAHDVACS